MPRKTRSQDDEKSVMVIGIDFGTTYSGTAFAHTTQPEDIEMVTNWPGGRNTDRGKCPTMLTYRAEEVAAWGYGAAEAQDAIHWFKLLLLQPEDVPADVYASDELFEARSKMADLGKQPMDLVADFLKELWALTRAKMAKSAVRTLAENSRFHVVLSVPAIWPNYAKEMMVEAARRAGICDDRPTRPPEDTILSLISEPEAAALTVLKEKFDDKITADGEVIAQVDDCFIVCDAGGGTVDLITYRIRSIRPWIIEECVRGDGKLCGAVILDKGFRAALRSKVSYKIWQKISNDPYIFDVQWEKIIKRHFEAGAQAERVHLPQHDKSIKDWPSMVTLTQNDMKDIFRPVTRSIVDLIRKQIASIPIRGNFKGAPAKYVVLVGGLGSSHHLYECLEAELSTGQQGPEILQSEGEKPWTAISRGAVLHGLNQQKADGRLFAVQSRIARQSYGTICTWEKWDPEEHDEADKRYCEVEDCYVADNQTSWFVRAGEPIGEGEIKLCQYSEALENPEDLEGGSKTELVYSDAPRPPKRCDKTVKKYCEVHWGQLPDFKSLPKRLTDTGREVRDLSYDIEMIFTGAFAHFGIWYDAKKVASKDVVVDFEDSGSAARK